MRKAVPCGDKIGFQRSAIRSIECNRCLHWRDRGRKLTTTARTSTVLFEVIFLRNKLTHPPSTNDLSLLQRFNHNRFSVTICHKMT